MVLPPSGKWQVAAPVVATLLPCCRAGSGGYASTTTDICFSFSSALRKPFGSSLCFLREAKRAERQRAREIEKILKYATKARWNFKLSRGLLIRPSGAGVWRGINFFRPRSCGLSNAAQCGARSCKQELPSCMQISWRYTHTLTLPLHPIMLHSVGS